MRLRLLPLVWLSACVLTVRDWQDARDVAVCEVTVSCFGTHGSVDACVDAAADGDEPECDSLRYGSMSQCLRQLRDQADACPDSLTDWEIPTICARVCRVGSD